MLARGGVALPLVDRCRLKEARSSECMGLLSSRGIGAQLCREAPEPELSFASSPLKNKNKPKHTNGGFAAAALFICLLAC